MEQVAEFIHRGFQLAIEINKSTTGTTLKDFKEKIHDPTFQAKIKELKESVENYASQFPMPGFDEL